MEDMSSLHMLQSHLDKVLEDSLSTWIDCNSSRGCNTNGEFLIELYKYTVNTNHRDIILDARPIASWSSIGVIKTPNGLVYSCASFSHSLSSST